MIDWGTLILTAFFFNFIYFDHIYWQSFKAQNWPLKKNLLLCKMKIETHNYGKEACYPWDVVLVGAESCQKIQCKLTNMCHRCSILVAGDQDPIKFWLQIRLKPTPPAYVTLSSCLAPVALHVAVNYKLAVPLQSLSEVSGTHAVDLHVQDDQLSYPWSPSLPGGWFLLRSYWCHYVLVKYPSLLGNWNTKKEYRKKIL